MPKETFAIVVGGGPAPGINGVISAAAIEAVNEGGRVLGIRGGFKSLCEGDRKAAVPLGIDDVSGIHSRGGSILRTARENPEKVRENFHVMMSMLKSLRVKYLITVGGDGTLTLARMIEREAKGSISVIHVPKTIDNDIPLPGGMPTFGYETARHVGVGIVSNLIEDARTTGRWYFVTTMGRYTGHLALGIGKASGATLTLIPEEFREKNLPIARIADVIEGAMIKRLSMGRDYGVVVLAEGIANECDPRELRKYECTGEDEAGRMRLSDIQLGRVLKHVVEKSLEKRGLGATIIDKLIGYELRAADPIPYDAEYTRNLGFGAVRLLLMGGSGAMISFYEGRLKAVPFVELADPETGGVRIRYVDPESEPYTVARNYMIRLEKDDLRPGSAKKLAAAGRMTEREFAKRFAYLMKENICG